MSIERKFLTKISLNDLLEGFQLLQKQFTSSQQKVHHHVSMPKHITIIHHEATSICYYHTQPNSSFPLSFFSHSSPSCYTQPNSFFLFLSFFSLPPFSDSFPSCSYPLFFSFPPHILILYNTYNIK